MLAATYLDDGIKSKFAGEINAAGDCVDRATGNARCGEYLEPLLGSARAQALDEE